MTHQIPGAEGNDSLYKAPSFHVFSADSAATFSSAQHLTNTAEERAQPQQLDPSAASSREGSSATTEGNLTSVSSSKAGSPAQQQQASPRDTEGKSTTTTTKKTANIWIDLESKKHVKDICDESTVIIATAFNNASLGMYHTQQHVLGRGPKLVEEGRRLGMRTTEINNGILRDTTLAMDCVVQIEKSKPIFRGMGDTLNTKVAELRLSLLNTKK